MAFILNIETSNTACSVALSADGMILKHRETLDGRNHAATLSDFIKDMLDFAKEKGFRLDAVAVSMGPGSYTGLRIGLSEAKGLAYGFDVPLIGISTLELMATGVMFSGIELTDETIFVPMLDARRMEVYTAAFDMGLKALMPPAPLILDEDRHPYQELIKADRPVLFFGNGMPKWRGMLGEAIPDNVTFIDGIEPLAVDMVALSEREFMKRNFCDIAYCTPLYLKEFQATTPRNKVL